MNKKYDLNTKTNANSKLNSKTKYKARYGIGGIIVAAMIAAAVALMPGAKDTKVAKDANVADHGVTKEIKSEEIPEYAGCAFFILNENKPYFSEEDFKVGDQYEYYGALDALGRCTVAEAMLSTASMPTEERGDISSVHPTGFVNQSYGNLVESDYLYNRCHLIAFSLAGENDNECNLITGTNYMNLQGMNPFETYLRNYLKDTGHHVFYRVTPIFKGENLVADGVMMEAQSIEDDEICFCIYVYNVQPGVSIDYKTGENEKSHLYEAYIGDTTAYIGEVAKGAITQYQSLQLMTEAKDYDYVVNINTGRVHRPDCASVAEIHSRNLRYYKGNYEDLVENGYILCNRCF